MQTGRQFWDGRHQSGVMRSWSVGVGEIMQRTSLEDVVVKPIRLYDWVWKKSAGQRTRGYSGISERTFRRRERDSILPKNTSPRNSISFSGHTNGSKPGNGGPPLLPWFEFKSSWDVHGNG